MQSEPLALKVTSISKKRKKKEQKVRNKGVCGLREGKWDGGGLKEREREKQRNIFAAVCRLMLDLSRR